MKNNSITRTLERLILAFALTCFASSSLAANIDAVVKSTTPKYATVTTNSNLMPIPGDKAKIYFKIPGGKVEVSVATGHVYEITGPNIMVQIDQATGTLAKNQLVRINSPHPKNKSDLAAPSAGNAQANKPAPNNAASPKPAAQTNNPTQRLVGTWQGPVHRTQILANGTFILDPQNPNPTKGQWKVKGDELIRSDPKRGIAVLKIVSLTDTELVVRDEKNATFKATKLPSTQ
jgi:hypothetical protein